MWHICTFLNMRFYLPQIIGPIVVGIGLLGNVLNLIVLTRPSLKGVTYSYLIGLALSDLGVLLCAVPMMVSFPLAVHSFVPVFEAHFEEILARKGSQ